MSDNTVSPSVVLPNLAVLLFVAIGLLSNSAPLVSQRPVRATPAEPRPAVARLWQDPLAVKPPTPRTSASAATAPGTPWLLASAEQGIREKLEGWQQRERRVPAPATFRALLLPVLVNGDSYPESVEARLRTRYAVLSALGRAQYVPLKPDQLLFASMPALAPASAVPGATSPSGRSDPARIPYEEFGIRYLVADNVEMQGSPANSRNDADFIQHADASQRVLIANPYDRVVVVWLNENQIFRLRDRRAENDAAAVNANLNTIVNTLIGDSTDRQYTISSGGGGFSAVSAGGAAVAASGDTVRLAWDVAVLGPSDSDRLASLLVPADEQKKAPNARPLTLYSPRATASEEVLQISATRANDFKIRVVPAYSNWTLRRTIAPDDLLVDQVMAELKLRNADPGGDRHLVLVGEWDTLYSRGLGRTFAAKINGGGSIARADRAAWARNPDVLHEFSYLRGLDGEIGDIAGAANASSGSSSDTTDAKSGDDDTDNPIGLKIKSASSAAEPAAGQTQLDYLRRLQGELVTLQNGLQRGNGGAGIAAIGVIGSDVYDKLLVLRALRANFPRTLFFTTDFDAIYLDHTDGPWTNNLLVFTPFGLKTSATLQGRIPPFRDSYQTALFLTVLKAVGVTDVGAQPFQLEERVIEPRVYEIGRVGYMNLSHPEASGHAALQERIERAHLPGSRHWLPALGLGVALVFALGLWISVLGPVDQVENTQIFYGILWLISVIGLTTGFTAGGFAAFSLPWIAMVGTLLLFLGWLFYMNMTARVMFVPRRDLNRKNPEVGAAILSFAVAGLALVLLRRCLGEIASSADEEPFAWFDGVSIWPTEIVRFIAGATAIYGIAHSQSRIRAVMVELSHRFELAPLDAAAAQPKYQWPRLWWRGLAHSILEKSPWMKSKTGNAHPEPNWSEHVWLARTPGGNGYIHEAAAWVNFCRVSAPQVRFFRLSLYGAIYILLSACLTGLTGLPFVPARGSWSHFLDNGVMVGSLMTYYYLLMYVFDATVLTAEFIGRLEPYIGRETKLPDAATINLIDRLCEVVSGLIYLPFSVLFMLIASRNALFDSWDWPAGLLSSFGLGLLLIVASALLLQNRARAAKRRALSALDEEIAASLEGTKRSTSATEAKARPPEAWLREMRAQTAAIEGVAFQSWYNNPIFRAILIPIGGVGSLQLLERFSSLF